MFGRKHSQETIIKMRAAALGRVASPEARRNMSLVRKGKANTPSQKLKISLALRGRPKTATHVANAAASQRGIKRPPLSYARKLFLSQLFKGKPRSSEIAAKILFNRWRNRKHPEYAGIKFRSSYEVRLAKAFDAHGIRWLYEPKRFNLGSCSYLPDFYLPKLKSYWEAKGYFAPESQAKVGLFRTLHPDKPLIVATKRVIEMMEQR